MVGNAPGAPFARASSTARASALPIRSRTMMARMAVGQVHGELSGHEAAEVTGHEFAMGAGHGQASGMSLGWPQRRIIVPAKDEVALSFPPRVRGRGLFWWAAIAYNPRVQMRAWVPGKTRYD